MQRKRDEWGFFKRCAIGASVAFAGVLTVPAFASATVVSTSGTTITVQGEAGDQDDVIAVETSPDVYLIDTPFDPINNPLTETSDDCAPSGGSQVTCTIPSLSALFVNLGDQEDALDSDGSAIGIDPTVHPGVDVTTIVSGGDGADSITTGVANDSLSGGSDSSVDTLTGNAGADFFDGGPGPDVYSGGADPDTLTYGDRVAADPVVVDLGDANPDGGTLDGAGDSITGVEGIIGTEGDDTITGDDSSDNEIDGNIGSDVLDGADGIDTVTYGERSLGVDIDIAAGLTDNGNIDDESGGGRDTLTDFENARGGSGNDSISGNTAGNLLQGGDGADDISGGVAEDLLDGAGGNDVLNGGADADSLFGFEGSDALSGGTEDDVLQGGDDPDAAAGDAGNDTIQGEGGSDSGTFNGLTGLDGGADNDTVRGGDGDDNMIGGPGTDRVSYQDSPLGVEVDLGDASNQVTNQGNDTLSGFENLQGSNSGSDLLIGDGGPNNIDGLDGVNQFEGLGGNDTFTGGIGSDTVSYRNETATTATLTTGTPGGTNSGGTDTFAGDIETLIGSPQGDTLTGNAAANDLEGLGGADTLAGLAEGDELVGDEGSDSLVGGDDDDELEGGDGDDTLEPGAGSDTADGDSDNDTVTYANSGSRVFVNLDAGAAGEMGTAPDTVEEVTDGTDDTVPNIENAIGSNHGDGDFIVGESGANLLQGGGGFDTIAARGGADDLIGGAESDTLRGEAGDDTLEGNAGTDTYEGGADTDTVTYENAGAAITLFLASNASDDGDGGSDGANSSVENAIGTPFGGDFVTGTGGPNNIDLGAGDNDIVFPSDGDDILDGGPGVSDGVLYNDGAAPVTVNLTTGVATGRGNDTLAGFERMNGSNGGDDTLIGDSGPNNISGLNGNDVFQGRGGADDLFGGGGTDTASYANAAGSVTAQLGPSAQGGSASIDGDGGIDNLGQMEALTGSQNADTLTGNGDSRLISALGGNDTLQLRNSGPDIADCGDGTDRANIDGSDTSLTACERADGPGATQAPQINGSNPGSGANDNSPFIQGSAPGGSTVTLYASADCSGDVLASGSAGEFNGAGLQISVADNSTTTISARAADNDIDGDSGCSNSVEYAEVTPNEPPPGDTTAPETAIAKLLKKTSDTTPTYKFSSSEQGSTFECKVDKGDFATCKSPHTLKKLKKGKHTFFVQATDAAGNTDATPAEDKFEVKKKKKKK